MHSSHNMQRRFDPHPPKKVPEYGGLEGSKLNILLGDHFLFQNDEFTKG